MSIKRMTAVWEHSAHKGANLLLLLALADNANDDGYCWPSIDTLARRTRTHRATVIRGIERLEITGEVIAHRSGRGNRYLVVVDMASDAVRAALEKHFRYTAEQCDEALKPKEQQSREKSQNATTAADGVSSRRMRPEKSQNATPVVASCAIEPSLTVIESPTVAAAPKNGATAGAQAKPKKARQRDPIFDAIAECSFSVPVGAEVAKDTAQRVGRVRREVLTIYPDVTEHELRGAYSWHVNVQKLTAPRDPVKVVTMVGVYRAQHRPAAASAIVRDPDCAVCGGTGLVLPALGAYEDGDPRANAPVQCAACAKAVRASEAQREAVGS